MLVGWIGQAALRVLFIFVVCSVILHIIGFAKRRKQMAWSKYLLLGQFVFAAIASAALITLLLTGDYHYNYVAEYTGPGLALIYKIAAFWGGNAGSLLFWALVLTLYGTVVAFSRHEDSKRMLPVVGFIVTIITGFYAGVLNFGANPFVYTAKAQPPSGLNPLLQNPGMTVHPVNVYLGYIGFAIPFAYAMTGLILKKTDATWLRVTRRWTLISWLFLSIGIVYGAHWSYEELGWGGYWAWDPVENAALLPWLTATAFLHSAVVQEKKGMLKGWNVILVTLTFLLSILGTFLTRSGVLWSIHSFANGPMGTDFLVYLTVFTVASLAVIVIRWPLLKADRKFEAVVSKESGFMLNNLLFLGSMFAVLWGTVFPIISEALTGHKLMVSAPFYNAVNLPLAAVILLLMGIGPVVAWRKGTLTSVLKSVVYPLLISIVVGFVISFLLNSNYDKQSWIGPLSIIGAAFVMLTVILEFVRSVSARVSLTGEAWLKSLLRLLSKNRRRYGGYIVHFAIAMMAIGIAGSGAYHIDLQQQLAPGQTAKIGNYQLTFAGMGVSPENQNRRMYADLVVKQGGSTLGVLQPAVTFYTNGQEPSTDIALYSRPLQDLYVVMLGTAKGSQAVFDMHVNPLVEFIWWGGYLFILGTVISLWPESFRRRSTDVSVSEHSAVEMAYQDLAELEYDYRMKKMDQETYEESKRELTAFLSAKEQRRIQIGEALRQEVRQELQQAEDKRRNRHDQPPQGQGKPADGHANSNSTETRGPEA